MTSVLAIDGAQQSGSGTIVRCIVPRETEHLTTNLWLIGQCGARGRVERRQVTIDGVGLTRVQTAGGAGVRQPTPIV